MKIPGVTGFLTLLHLYKDPLPELAIFIFDLLNASRVQDTFLNIFIKQPLVSG